MSHPSQKQSRRRTFRVEALESRELLSTAAYATHPAPVAAPLSRVALVSRTAGDPVIKAKLQGQLLINEPKITFSAGGFVDLKHEPTPVLFRGTITKYEKTGHDNFTFKDGGAEFFDQNVETDYFIFTVKAGSADKQKFTASGKTIPGNFGASGIFRGMKATFTATGKVTSTGDLTIELKIEYERA